MGLLPRATLHAAAPSQSKKKQKQNDIQLQRHEEQWHRRGEEAAEPAARYRVCLPPLPFGEEKNKAKQSKQNTTTRRAAAARLPPDRHGANICARLVGRVGRGAAVDFFARPAWRSKQPPPVSCVFFRNKPIIPPLPATHPQPLHPRAY